MSSIKYKGLELHYDLIDEVPGKDLDYFIVYRNGVQLQDELPENINSGDVFEHHSYDVRLDELSFEGRYKLI